MKQFIVCQSMEVVNSWIISANSKEEAMEKFLNVGLTQDEYATFGTSEGDIKNVWAEDWDLDEEENEN